MSYKYKYKKFEFQGGSFATSPETISALDELGNQGWLLADNLKCNTAIYTKEGAIWFGLFVKILKG